MRLRTRLLLGYGYLVLLVLFVAGISTAGFFHLSRGIRFVLRENFDSVRAALEMEQALERQDSAVLQTLVEHTPAKAKLEATQTAFRRALVAADQNVTIAGERAVVSRIADSYAALDARKSALIASPSPSFDQYERSVYPEFLNTKEDVLALMELNSAAMIEADKAAIDQASRFELWIGLIALVALISLVVIARGLQDYVVRRLDELSRVARAVGSGDLRVRVPMTHDDELGQVASLLNESLDQAAELRNRADGVTDEGRKLAIALFETWGQAPAALLDASGAVLARLGTLDEIDVLIEAPDTVARPLELHGRMIGSILQGPHGGES